MLPNLSALRVEDPEPTEVVGDLWRGAKRLALGDPNAKQSTLRGLQPDVFLNIAMEIFEEFRDDEEDGEDPVISGDRRDFKEVFSDPCTMLQKICSKKLDMAFFAGRPWAQDKNAKRLLAMLNRRTLVEFCEDAGVGEYLLKLFTDLMTYSNLSLNDQMPTVHHWFWEDRPYPRPDERPKGQTAMQYLLGLCDAYDSDRRYWIAEYQRDPTRFRRTVAREITWPNDPERFEPEYYVEWFVAHHPRPRTFSKWMSNDLKSVAAVLDVMSTEFDVSNIDKDFEWLGKLHHWEDIIGEGTSPLHPEDLVMYKDGTLGIGRDVGADDDSDNEYNYREDEDGEDVYTFRETDNERFDGELFRADHFPLSEEATVLMQFRISTLRAYMDAVLKGRARSTRVNIIVPLLVLRKLHGIDKLNPYGTAWTPAPLAQNNQIKEFIRALTSNRTLRRFVVLFPSLADAIASALRGK